MAPKKPWNYCTFVSSSLLGTLSNAYPPYPNWDVNPNKEERFWLERFSHYTTGQAVDGLLLIHNGPSKNGHCFQI